MGDVTAISQRIIDAPAEQIAAFLRDYEQHHLLEPRHRQWRQMAVGISVCSNCEYVALFWLLHQRRQPPDLRRLDHLSGSPKLSLRRGIRRFAPSENVGFQGL
jgi:hypothetical protein